MIAKITLGTRGSELARAQTLLVEKAIRTAHPSVAIETKIIGTRADDATVVDLNAGRKGLFTAEIERALLAGEVDAAVHSAKDLPSQTNPGAQIAAVLPRAPINDVLISKYSGGLTSVPCGATVATASVRRQRQLHWKRAALKVVDLRGNVPTRLRKLAVNATISNGKMKLRAQVFEGESPLPRQAEIEGDCDEGYTLAAELLRRIKQT